MSERLLKMPRLGETMDEGRIANWLIAPGATFQRGDAILEIETDKTIAEYPALGGGTLVEILIAAGEMADVGTPIARIELGGEADWTDGEDASGVPSPAAASALPDASRTVTDLAMPRLGETMDEGRIARWLKAAGESFVRGEAIIEIETDKTVAEYPALVDGALIEIMRQEGDLVPVGEPIARIEIAADAAPPQTRTGNKKPSPPEAATAVTATRMPSSGTHGRVRATPLARRLARRHKLDITAIAGTGRRGRIEKADVLRATAGPAPAVAAAGNGVLRIDLTRGRMAFADSGGAGRPFLLLHGFAGDRTTWAALQSGLRRAGRRVIAPDLPGHGLTEIEAASVTDLSRDLIGLLDALQLNSVSLVAHSLGAAAAIALATEAGNRISDVTLIAPAGLGSSIDQDFIRIMASGPSPGEIAHMLRRLSVTQADLSPAALDALAADLGRKRLEQLADALAGPSGQRIDTVAPINTLAAKLPVRVLFGLEDRIIPWQQITALPPSVAVHLFARSGHLPQVDQTRDVLDILLQDGGRDD